MTERTYSAKLRDRDLTAPSDRLAEFRDAYISGSELATRMSELIWFHIYVLDAEFGVSPHDVLRSIKEPENGEPTSGVKPATQFKKMLLKGLWHKHYFSAHFILENIRLGLGKTGLDAILNKTLNPAKSDVVTREIMNDLAHRVVHEPLDARNTDGKLTGEWIVYLRRGGKNYYLCCNTHESGDQFIYDQIMEHCVRDFSDLPAWLKEEPESKAA